MIDMERMTAELKQDEGFKECMYQCTAGANTIGYGFNLDTEKMPERIAHLLLVDGIMWRLEMLEQHDWFHTLNDNRQRVILNMAFNLGMSGMLSFKGMIAAIREGDYVEAAVEMEDSNWYWQVGDRAKRLVEMMRNG